MSGKESPIEGRASSRHRGPGGHGHGHGPMMPGEKARDFKGSMRKMLAFMGQFKLLVAIVLAFAIGSTVFNIVGPKVLSEATTVLFEGVSARIAGTGSIDFDLITRILATTFASTVFNIVGPKVLSEATTVLFEGVSARIAGTGSIDFDLITRILATTFALYVASAACSWVQGWVMSYVSQQTCYRLRRAIAEKIDRMPFGFFDKNSTGDTLSRITNDVDTLGQSLNQGVTQLVTSLVTVVGVVVMMLSINLVMTLITLVMVPVSLVLVAVVVKRSQKYFYAQQAQLGAINAQVEETFSGHAVVKAFCREEEVVEAYLATNEKLYQSAWRSQFLSGLMKPVMDFVGNLGYVAVAIAGAFLAVAGAITVGDIQAFIQYVKNFTQPITQLAQVVGNLGYVAVAIAGAFLAVAGAITVGDIQAFIQYVKNFTQPITQLAQVSNVLQQMAAAAERIFAFIELPEEERTEPRAAASEVSGDVEFDHVRFGYDENAPVINDFTASIAQGQMVAIVGPTGAGKTTLVKLLMRFYDVQGGSITLGGVDTRDFSREDVRSQFAMVLQDTWLFSGTIRENIRYGKLDATDEEVEQAARGACAHRFITTLPGGYDFEINEDASNISQGQRQLLTIARDEEVEQAARGACAHRFITTLPGGYDFEINEDASNISQGQRQLLTIARALLADRRMLILDEATSSVDTHHRPCSSGGSTHAHPRRGDVVGRHAHRVAHPACHGQPHARQDLVRHRTPALHHSQRRSHPGGR